MGGVYVAGECSRAEYQMNTYALDEYRRSERGDDCGGFDPTLFTSKKTHFRDLIRDSFGTIQGLLNFLSPVDSVIVRLYCLDGLSHEQISYLLRISQAAVSRRFKLVFERIRFLLKMPTLSVGKVREDFEELFEPELFEFAFYFYWVCSQSRVKLYIHTSQSGASNKLKKILGYLEEVSSLSETQIVNSEIARKRYLALIYREYFLVLTKKSSLTTFLFKKNDEVRANSLVRGASIFECEGEKK